MLPLFAQRSINALTFELFHLLADATRADNLLKHLVSDRPLRKLTGPRSDPWSSRVTPLTPCRLCNDGFEE